MHIISEVDSWLWPAFIVSVVVLLILDLFVFNRESHTMSFKEAIKWSCFWLTLAALFNVWFAVKYGQSMGLQFTTGYIIELSLSVDNLFVMLLIFKSFKIPQKYQHGVLFWGILGAILFRGFMILLGVDLIHKFHWLLYIFGAILLLSAIKFLFESDDKKDVTESWFVRKIQKILPISKNLNGKHFFIHEDGIRKATPLLLTLIVVEFTDVVFAVDSVPAVLSVTRDAFIAFASNILALLGLRSLYFVVADGVDKLKYLKPGLSFILAFVGLKMILADFVPIPTWASLLVIVCTLIVVGLTSWYVVKRAGPPVSGV